MQTNARTDRIYRSTAKADFGLTDRELDSLPAKEVPNRNYRSGPPARLYLRADVERLANSPVVQDRLARKAERDDPAAKEARRQERERKILRRYSSGRDAMLPACEAMFNLNRYAKHKSCQADHRDEIYGLKNQLISLLYTRGFCIECVAHERTLPEKRCFGCDGSGSDWDGGSCDRCGGTGIYLEAKTLRDIAFKFDVDGHRFAWHQPDHLVSFPYKTTATLPGAPTVEKPVEMSPAKMREGKVIIRYVLEELE